MPSVFEWLHLNLRGKSSSLTSKEDWNLKTWSWDLYIISVSLLQRSASALTRLDLCCDISPSLSIFFVCDHTTWRSLIVPVKPFWAKGQWPFLRSVIGWVRLSQSSSFVFSGKEIQSQSNCKILSGLKPGQGCLSSANIFGDHFCDRDWKEYRK